MTKKEYELHFGDTVPEFWELIRVTREFVQDKKRMKQILAPYKPDGRKKEVTYYYIQKNKIKQNG